MWGAPRRLASPTDPGVPAGVPELVPGAGGGALEISGLAAGYDGRAVIHDCSLRVPEGGFACLLGPSGCGKTTLLRAVAGLEPVLAGRIAVASTVVAEPGFMVPPERRKVGMVFQDNTLFPHLTVAGNVAFGLRGQPAARVRAVVEEMLALVGMEGLGGRYVHELSGGQQQRVALARALAPEPRLVLLDEPFSSLDTELREHLGREVQAILRARGITTLLVTHDQGEAFALAAQIGVMRDGRLLQWASAYDLYHEPADRFIADFIGKGVFLRGRLERPDAVSTEIGLIEGNRAYPWPIGSEVEVLLRPDDIQPDPEGGIEATVTARAFQGAWTLYTLRLTTGAELLSLFPSHRDHHPGERVRVRATVDHLIAFPLQ